MGRPSLRELRRDATVLDSSVRELASVITPAWRYFPCQFWMTVMGAVVPSCVWTSIRKRPSGNRDAGAAGRASRL